MERNLEWLQVARGDAPLLVSFPHTGTELVDGIEEHFVSPWLARRDTDWWIHHLYDFAAQMGANTVRTSISRSIIDVNRDPDGRSLYPGMATTELCPTMTFDGQALYRSGYRLDATEIERRRLAWFDPYHAALDAEIERLLALHPVVVVYDAHSIRSRIPRLFDGELPQFNIGTNSDTSCDVALTDAVEKLCAASGLRHVRNGRFKGGYITRKSGRPANGVHAIQMELACRGYLPEPDAVTEENWPPPWQQDYAESLRATLQQVLQSCLDFTTTFTRNIP